MGAVGVGGDGNGDQVGEGGTKEDSAGRDNRNRWTFRGRVETKCCGNFLDPGPDLSVP